MGRCAGRRLRGAGTASVWWFAATSSAPTTSSPTSVDIGRDAERRPSTDHRPLRGTRRRSSRDRVAGDGDPSIGGGDRRRGGRLRGAGVVAPVAREWGDAGPLAALGMTRTGMVRAAAWRAVPIAAISAAVAFVVLVASSPLGPVGVGRNAETAPGLRMDSLVAAVGIPVIAAVTMLFAVVPIARVRRGIDIARDASQHPRAGDDDLARARRGTGDDPIATRRRTGARVGDRRGRVGCRHRRRRVAVDKQLRRVGGHADTGTERPGTRSSAT